MLLTKLAFVLLPLLDGLLEDTGGDADAIANSAVGKETGKFSIDLAKPSKPSEEQVTFQVDALKTIGGSLKGFDQQCGGCAVRGAHRRGEPLEDVPVGDNHNASYRGGMTCNFDAAGVLNTVFTRASFSGSTSSLAAPRAGCSTA